MFMNRRKSKTLQMIGKGLKGFLKKEILIILKHRDIGIAVFCVI